MTRFWLGALASLALLAGCAAPDIPEGPTEPMGDFRMGFTIVVANDVTRGPASREASEEELVAAVTEALETRLDRYDGDGLYHVGLRVEAYVLARPGVPLLYNPQSVMLLALNIWDDASQTRLNPEPVRITALEPGGFLTPSGLVNTREAQLETLAAQAARKVEDYLRANEAAWFAPRDDRTRTPFSPDMRSHRRGDQGETPETAAE